MSQNVPVSNANGHKEGQAIYKSFIRPHLDYGDTLYDQTLNTSFHEKFESIQHNTVLAITGAIRGDSREKPYQKL